MLFQSPSPLLLATTTRCTLATHTWLQACAVACLALPLALPLASLATLACERLVSNPLSSWAPSSSSSLAKPSHCTLLFALPCYNLHVPPPLTPFTSTHVVAHGQVWSHCEPHLESKGQRLPLLRRSQAPWLLPSPLPLSLGVGVDTHCKLVSAFNNRHHEAARGSMWMATCRFCCCSCKWKGSPGIAGGFTLNKLYPLARCANAAV